MKCQNLWITCVTCKNIRRKYTHTHVYTGGAVCHQFCLTIVNSISDRRSLGGYERGRLCVGKRRKSGDLVIMAKTDNQLPEVIIISESDWS